MGWRYGGLRKGEGKKWSYSTNEGKLEAYLSENGKLNLSFPDGSSVDFTQTEVVDLEALQQMGGTRRFFRRVFLRPDPTRTAFKYQAVSGTSAEDQWSKYISELSNLPPQINSVVADISDRRKIMAEWTAIQRKSDTSQNRLLAHNKTEKIDPIKIEPSGVKAQQTILGSVKEKTPVEVYDSKAHEEQINQDPDPQTFFFYF